MRTETLRYVSAVCVVLGAVTLPICAQAQPTMPTFEPTPVQLLPDLIQHIEAVRAGGDDAGDPAFRGAPIDEHALHWAIRRLIREGEGPTVPIPFDGEGDGQGQPMPQAISNYGGDINILHKDVDLEVDVDTGEARSVARVVGVVTGTEPQAALRFIMPSWDLLSVTGPEGEPLPYEEIGSVLEIGREDGEWLEGDSFDITVEVEGAFECNNSFPRACTFGSNLNYVTYARFHPGNPQQRDAWTANFSVTTNSPWRVAATGEPLDPVELEDGRTRYSFILHEETFWLSFGAARYEVFTDATQEPPINLYIRETYADNADNLLVLGRSIIDTFVRYYADFPYKNLDMVEFNDNFGGGYGPQATIFMVSYVFGINPSGGNGSGYLVQLMSHEIAHQWWGNFVTPKEEGNVVLSEGLAEFSSASFYREYYESAGNFIDNAMTYLYTVDPSFDVPISSTNLQASDNYFTLAYDKASAVFNMLRLELGDDAYFAGMQLYSDTYAYGGANLEEYFAVMESVSGQNLDAFYEQWILDDGYPRHELTATQWANHDGTWSLELVIEQTGKRLYELGLPVRFDFAVDAIKGVQSEFRTIRIDEEVTRVTFTFDHPIKRTRVDPDKAIIQLHSVGQAADVNLDGESDGIDLLDMAIRVGRDIVVPWGGGSFYANPGYERSMDLNSDGKIDESDVELMLLAPQTTE